MSPSFKCLVSCFLCQSGFYSEWINFVDLYTPPPPLTTRHLHPYSAWINFFYLDNPPLPPPCHPLSLRIENNNGRAFSWLFLFASDTFLNGKGNKINEGDVDDKENPQLAGVRVGQAYHPVQG